MFNLSWPCLRVTFTKQELNIIILVKSNTKNQVLKWHGAFSLELEKCSPSLWTSCISYKRAWKDTEQQCYFTHTIKINIYQITDNNQSFWSGSGFWKNWSPPPYFRDIVIDTKKLFLFTCTSMMFQKHPVQNLLLSQDLPCKCTCQEEVLAEKLSSPLIHLNRQNSN